MEGGSAQEFHIRSRMTSTPSPSRHDADLHHLIILGEPVALGWDAYPSLPNYTQGAQAAQHDTTHHDTLRRVHRWQCVELGMHPKL